MEPDRKIHGRGADGLYDRRRVIGCAGEIAAAVAEPDPGVQPADELAGQWVATRRIAGRHLADGAALRVLSRLRAVVVQAGKCHQRRIGPFGQCAAAEGVGGIPVSDREPADHRRHHGERPVAIYPAQEPRIQQGTDPGGTDGGPGKSAQSRCHESGIRACFGGAGRVPLRQPAGRYGLRRALSGGRRGSQPATRHALSGSGRRLPRYLRHGTGCGARLFQGYAHRFDRLPHQRGSGPATGLDGRFAGK